MIYKMKSSKDPDKNVRLKKHCPLCLKGSTIELHEEDYSRYIAFGTASLYKKFSIAEIDMITHGLHKECRKFMLRK